MKELKYIEEPYFLFDNKVYRRTPKTIWYNFNIKTMKYIIDIRNDNDQIVTLELNTNEVFESKEDLLKSL